MSTIRLELDGIEQLMTALRGMGQDITDQVSAAVTKTALDVDRDIKRRMQQSPASGRVYRRGKGQNRSRLHRASAPGQAPAIDSGTLLRSIMFKQISPLTAEVFSKAKYGRRLEYGGTDSRGTYIAPRPAWRPAVMAHQDKLRDRIEAAVKAAMQ